MNNKIIKILPPFFFLVVFISLIVLLLSKRPPVEKKKLLPFSQKININDINLISMQSKRFYLKNKNLYPNGNSPYKDILLIAYNKKYRTKNNKNKFQQNKLNEELQIASFSKRKKNNLLRQYNTPIKKRKLLKNLTDFYKVFDKDIDTSRINVQEAIETGSRTNKEIEEALEAIRYMKMGQRKLLEKIQTVQESLEDDNYLEDLFEESE